MDRIMHEYKFFSLSKVDLLYTVTPEDSLLAKEKFLELSREAQFIITLIMIGAIIEMTEFSLGEITDILRKCGWKWKQIREGKKEIRRYLNENRH